MTTTRRVPKGPGRNCGDVYCNICFMDATDLEEEAQTTPEVEVGVPLEAAGLGIPLEDAGLSVGVEEDDDESEQGLDAIITQAEPEREQQA